MTWSCPTPPPAKPVGLANDQTFLAWMRQANQQQDFGYPKDVQIAPAAPGAK